MTHRWSLPLSPALPLRPLASEPALSSLRHEMCSRDPRVTWDSELSLPLAAFLSLPTCPGISSRGSLAAPC